jgi:predicted N-formylglutamate amidohydrolase
MLSRGITGKGVSSDAPLSMTLLEDILARDYPLVAPHEAPPVQLLNEGGSARVLLVGDHASNTIPEALGQLGLEDWILERHVAYDIGSRALLEHLALHLDATALLAGYSRLVIDLNRALSDPTAIPEVSDGIEIPGNRNLSDQQREARITSFYTPYRLAIDRLLDDYRDHGAVPAFVAVHSFTPEMAGAARPWHIGLLWDKDSRIARPLMERLREHPFGINVGDNEPYSGRHPADYTIDHHAEARGIPHISIEVRQDLVSSAEGAEQWATILHEALREVLIDARLYRYLDT